MEDVIEFKSNSENYLKEKCGKKSNTMRPNENGDGRYKLLWKMQMSGKYGKIKILLDSDDENSTFFVRQITDVTFYKDCYVVSWDCNEKDGESTL